MSEALGLISKRIDTINKSLGGTAKKLPPDPWTAGEAERELPRKILRDAYVAGRGVYPSENELRWMEMDFKKNLEVAQVWGLLCEGRAKILGYDRSMRLLTYRYSGLDTQPRQLPL